VANPSSFLYLDDKRPVLRKDKRCKTMCDNKTAAQHVYSFLPHPSGKGATGAGNSSYNKYGYGFEDTFPEYMGHLTREQFAKSYRHRSVTYLSGSADVCNSAFQSDARCNGTFGCSVHDDGMDTSHAAYAQGWCRMERAHAFAQYVRHLYNDSSAHALVPVAGVGHNTCAMLQAPESQKAMFEPIGPSLGPSFGPFVGPSAGPSTWEHTEIDDGSGELSSQGFLFV